MGVCRGRLRQRRPRRRLHHGARRRPAVPQRGRRQVPRRDEGVGHQERQLRHQRRLARLRPRRQGSISSWPTTCSGAADKDLWCSLDGATKSYCTPESYKGTASKLYRNLGDGKFEDATAEGRRRRSHQQVARHRRPRLQRRRLARPVRGQRHAAQQALPQQQERHVRRGGAGGGRRLRRGRRRARRHGRRRRRLRPLRPPAPAGRQLLQPDARPLPQRRQAACSSTRRRASTVGRASLLTAHLRRLLLRLRPRRLARHLRRQRPHRGGDRPRAAEGARTSSRRCSSATSGQRQVRARWPPAHGTRRSSDRRRSWRAAPPTATTTGTATSTWPVTTNHGPAYLFRNDGGNRNNWLRGADRGTKSNRDGIGAVVRVTSARADAVATWCAAARATLAERPGADLRPRPGCRCNVDRDRMAERRPRSDR